MGQIWWKSGLDLVHLFDDFASSWACWQNLCCGGAVPIVKLWVKLFWQGFFMMGTVIMLQDSVDSQLPYCDERMPWQCIETNLGTTSYQGCPWLP